MCCNEQQTFFLVTLSCYLAGLALLWRSILLKPFKLWTVFLHEFSHACAVWLTCNEVTGIEVNAQEGGLTHWKARSDRMGCSRQVVLPAGYLGSALWSCAILLSAFGFVYSSLRCLRCHGGGCPGSER